MSERKISLTDGFIHIPITIDPPKRMLPIRAKEGEVLAHAEAKFNRILAGGALEERKHLIYISGKKFTLTTDSIRG